MPLRVAGIRPSCDGDCFVSVKLDACIRRHDERTDTLPTLKDRRYLRSLNTMNKQFYVYILASKRNGTLYTGITSDLVRRVWVHKQDIIKGFTNKYSVKTLVFFEVHHDAESAISREKQIKKWKRAWKLKLIEKINPMWRDLYADIRK